MPVRVNENGETWPHIRNYTDEQRRQSLDQNMMALTGRTMEEQRAHQERMRRINPQSTAGLLKKMGGGMWEKLTDIVGGTAALVLGLLTPIGALYWLWMAVQLKSFAMFIVGFAGPSILLTAPIGAYSLLFGMPDWIASLFG